MKIVAIFSSYGPYHIARMNAAAMSFLKLNWNLVGIELSRNQVEYPWITDASSQQFPIISLFSDQYLETTNPLRLIYRLISALRSSQPDVILVAGYFRISMIFALLWGIIHKKKVILFSESTEIDSERNQLKEYLKKIIVSLYSSALVGGKPQQRYLEKLGMKPDAIFLGYNVVGNDIFFPSKIRRLPRPIKTHYFLAVNRFIPKKNLAFLVSAYSEYRETASDAFWDLILCGDGELRQSIQTQVSSLRLEKHIHFPGFLQQNELLPYFAHATCFIHASTHEQWGLVVNEAMAAGLPVLVSKRCGCAEDLVLNNINGFSFDPYDQHRLVQLMQKISSEEIDINAMGKCALKHIGRFSPEYFARGLQAAIDYSLA